MDSVTAHLISSLLLFSIIKSPHNELHFFDFPFVPENTVERQDKEEAYNTKSGKVMRHVPPKAIEHSKVIIPCDSPEAHCITPTISPYPTREISKITPIPSQAHITPEPEPIIIFPPDPCVPIPLPSSRPLYKELDVDRMTIC